MTVVGVMSELIEGETVKFSGDWVENNQYGRQFKAERFLPLAPESEKGITRYLIDAVLGIGEATAKRIYDHFGDATLSIIEQEPERLSEIGLKPKIIENARQALQQNRIERLIMVDLQNYGISPYLARKIYAEYGAASREILRTDPYQIALDVEGIGFKRADLIARGIGIATDSKQRVRAGLVYTVEQLSLEGHTFVPRDELVDAACKLLEVSNRTLVATSLSEHIAMGGLFSEPIFEGGNVTEAVYLPLYYRSELGVVRRLRDMLQTPSELQKRAKDIHWKDFLKTLSALNNVELTAQQQGAVQAVFKSKVSVLTGGPGTGKTTTLQMVINALEEEEFTVALASPTGRAAKRLAEATGREAKTIHRLLEFSPHEGGFQINEENPLECDVLVVDESSMLDLVLFYTLLKALPAPAHLMLVGDVDQLPSVGAGNVLNDVIASEQAFVTRLGVIFRQDNKSHIVQNAHRINHGELPFMSNESSDFFFFQVNESAKIGEMVVDVVTQRVPNKFGFNALNDIQVLAPMYRGPAGVDAINTSLQAALNSGLHLAEVRIGGRILRMRDKVMQTKNNYEKEIFNGDIGRIIALDPAKSKIIALIDEREVEYTFKEAEDQLILAYCISTHRSQGSEYPVIVMPITSSHYMMLQRNLLYTAITRARRLVILVGERRAVAMAVSNDKVAQRHSGLLPRLKAMKP